MYQQNGRPFSEAPIGLVPMVIDGSLNTVPVSTTNPLPVQLQTNPTIDIGDVTLLAGSAIVGKVGIDQTTPGTTNGVQVNAALPAGEAHVGQVGGISAQASGNFTRPADTTQYASGDLVANSATAGSVTPVTLAVGRGSSGAAITGMVRRITLRKSGTSLTSASFRVHLYNATSITCANGDNGAWSTDKVANYIGSFDVTMDRAFTDGACGLGAPNNGSEVNFTTQNIYALVEARAVYTPGNAEVFTIIAEVVQN